MAVKFTNNAATTLAAGINSSATSISVTDGSVFPSLSSGEHFYCTFDDTTNVEIVKVTARSSNTLTVVRGQDNTTARAFSSGDKAELRVVAALLEDVKTEVTSTLSVDTFTGDDSTTAFTLSQAPASEDNLIVFIEGVYQNPGDFTLSGTTLTLDVAPANTRKVVAYHVSGAVSGNNLNHDQFTCNGSTTAFTLSLSPIHENNTQVFLDGVYQQKTDYAVSGTTLTMDTAPSNGAILEVMTFTQTDVNTIPASFVAGLTEVSAVGADHLLVYDATDGALKKALASDLIETVGATPTFTTANITNTTTGDSLLFTTTEDSSTAAPVITLKRNSGSPADADYLGQLKFKGENDADQEVVYAKITSKIQDASDGSEDGLLEFANIKAGSQTITARLKSDKLQLLNSTGLEVAGLTYPTSDGSNGQALVTDGSGNLSFSTISGGASAIDGLSDGTTQGTRNTGLGANALDDGSLSGTQNTAVGHSAATSNTSATNTNAFGYYALGNNTTGANNSAFGTESLGANTTGHSNCAFGKESLLSNTTGNENIAIGTNALRLNTTASNNVAVGVECLDANTTGTQNTAMGKASMSANTTGSYNTAYGAYSLDANTTAGYQTAIGYAALGAVNGGLENVAVGANSLATNASGSYNTGVGTNSLYDNTGSYNVAVGYDALSNNTSATHNVAVGFRAGNGITTGGDTVVVGNYAGYTGIGTRSVAVGYSAGYNCTGSGNTLIGMNTGQGSYPLTSGSNCTMIGYLARPSGTLGNANNENVFGMNMSANGTNTTTLGAGGSGLYASHGSNSWTSISDERYKKDIVDSEVGLSFINDLRPRNFKWKTCGEVPDDTPRYEEDSDELLHPNLTGVMHGFIAQEVKAVIDNHSEVPDNQLIWKQDPDGIQGLAEGELVPALVKAIQELSAKNDALEARIETLESN